MGEQKPEKTKKHICAGLLAHVYAGKTLLSPRVSQPPFGRQGTKRSASFSKKRDAAESCVPLF